MRFIQKNLLLIVVAAAVVLAWLLPGPGARLKATNVVPILIALTFLCQGAALTARRFRAARTYLGLLALGATISLVVAPAMGWTLMKLVHWPRDLHVGFLLMCCMGPTLVSGIVIATQSGGEREAAALLTVAVNLLSIVVIPLTLVQVIGGGQSLDRLGLLSKLLAIVLLPAVLGQLLRWRLPQLIEPSERVLTGAPIALLGGVIYLSLAQHADNLARMPLPQLLLMALPAIAVHYLLLFLGYAMSRAVLQASHAQATALAVVSSQKTLPVAVAVWSTEFATAYPLALLPAIIFHFVQVYGDTLLAGPWSRRQLQPNKTARR